MRDLTPRQSRTVSLLLLSTVVFMVGARAHAAAPVTQYVVIQPIDVCDTSGPSGATGCAPFNTLSPSPDPTKATLTTPIGFVDAATNVNITRAIWLQAGIDVTFLPIAEYNNTNYEAITDITCTTTTPTTCSSTNFKALSSAKQLLGAPPLIDSACKTNCTVPLAPTMANAINMFFVNSLGASSGFAWLNGNGIAIAADVFSLFPSTRFDTLAHEIGHNLNLDHFTFGAGTLCKNTPSPQGCNVLDAGAIRVVPLTSGCSSSSTTDGALFDLDTGLCGTSVPRVPQADQLILGTSTTVQQAQALLSGFMNPIPNVNALAGGGKDVAFTVDFPPLHEAGGRPGQYIFALVLALPNGFKFGTNLFTPTGGTITTGGSVQVFGFQLLNGNNGKGNENCLKPISGAPSIECLEIDFDPGTFTAGTSISFMSDIVSKTNGASATAAELACTPPAPLGCLDLTYAFSDLLATSSAFVLDVKTGNTMAGSQTPDPGVRSTIVDPADFQSVVNHIPPLTLTSPTWNPVLQTSTACTLTGTSTSCPSPAHGDSTGPD